MSPYTFYVPPPPMGYWVLPGSAPTSEVRFMMTKKPNWLYRTFMRVLLGWEWRDSA